MAKGGARPGAGRPVGSITRPQLRDYWTPEQIKDFFEGLYERQKTSDRIAVWCAEQMAGKAPSRYVSQVLGKEYTRGAVMRTVKEDIRTSC